VSKLVRALIVMSLAFTVTTAACSGNGPTDAADADSRTSVRTTAPADELGRQVDEFFDKSLSVGLRDRRALLVSQGGRMLVERYYGGSDASTTSDVFSVTKSIMATLVGVAVDQDLLALDDTLADLLPQYAQAMSDERAAVTLREVLTMTAGLPPDEFGDPTGLSGPDVVAGVVSAPPAPQGEDFAYSSAGSHLLSAILVQATGRPVLEYTREVLFDPLGVQTRPAHEPVIDLNRGPTADEAEQYEAAAFAWPRDAQGRHWGFGAVKLTARDMAALGQLYLDGGRWEDQQIVSSSWIEQATQAQVPTGGADLEHYGYQWWITETNGHPAYAAIGYGGQLIQVVPDLALIVIASTTVKQANPVSDKTYRILIDNVIAPWVESNA
jgi:CubicO group peptidase (beta-lactamase class C family)